MAKCMFQARNLSKGIWVKAVNTKFYLLNRSPTNDFRNITPEEACTGRKPLVKHLCIFRCTSYAHIPTKKGKS